MSRRLSCLVLVVCAGCAQPAGPPHGSTTTGVEPTVAASAGPSVTIDRRSLALGAETMVRSRELIEREIATSEGIVERMAPGDSRGADLYRRLAECYVILAQEWSAARSESQAAQYRQSAIRTYARLIQDYPEDARMDEDLYLLAYELEAMHQSDQALQVYMRLIRHYPQSRLVPHAWLAFGEHYFDDGDPSAARHFYAKVLEYPPETPNSVYGDALYRQAWVLYQLEDYGRSLTQFADVLAFTERYPESHHATRLAQQSLLDLVYPYQRVGTWSEALSFFRRYASDDAHAYAMFEQLGDLDYAGDERADAAEIYRALIAAQPRSERVARWRSRVVDLTAR